MGEPRTAQAILDDVRKWVEIHVGMGMNVHQEKADFFKLCREAHRAGYHETSSRPRLAGDAIYDALKAQWSPHEDQTRLATLRVVCDLWGEWLYALDRY